MFPDCCSDWTMLPDRVLDPERFAEVEVLVGRAGALRLLRRLAQDLSDAFGDPRSDATEFARQAHDMTSAAGLIGFSQLSDTCRRLESACKTGLIDPSLLRQARHERDRVMLCLDALLTTLERQWDQP